MKKILFFPWFIIPALLGIYNLTQLAHIKSIDEAYSAFLNIVCLCVAVAFLAIIQGFLIELYCKRQTQTFISYLDYLGRTNKHIVAMKNKSFMHHAKDWKFKQFEAPHYTK